jgi:EmrB/QacA subfamily drug resistance transporter
MSSPKETNLSSPPSSQSGPREPPKNQARLGLILGLLVTAQFIVVLDFSIVQIALPTIQTELDVSLANLQWIVGAYGLTFAGLLMLSGRASDLYGRKNLFMIGLAIFSLSSLAGGLASSEVTLIVARALQGVGAALASAAGLALIVTTFAPLGRLNWALGIFTAVSSAGFTAGVILGGVITDALGWRWVFFVNVPIGIVAAALAISVLPAGLRSTGRHLDVPGAISITAGLMLLVYALTNVGNGDLSARTLALFGVAALVLVGFLAIERRSKGPLMPLGFLRRGAIFLPNAIALLVFAANTSMIFVMTLYLQEVEGYSALNAGLALVPPAIIYFVLGGFVAPRLVRRIGAKQMLIAAMVFLALGLFLLSRITLDSDYATSVLAPLMVAAVGGSLALTGSNIAALGGARPGEEGIASGLINTSRQVGGPVGLAVIVTVIDIVTGGLGVGASAAGLVSGFRYALGVASAFAILALVLALMMTDSRKQTKTISSSDHSAKAPQPVVTPSAID